MKFKSYLLLAALALCTVNLSACGDKTDQPTQPTAAVTQPGPIPADSLGATPEADTDPAQMATEQQQTTAAMMKVAKTLASSRGTDPVAVVQFCEQNASAFANQEEVNACKNLVSAPVAINVPRNLDEVQRTAATLPLKQRFEFCTSTAVLKLTKTQADYARCFPPSSQAQLAAQGGLDALDIESEPVTADELREQVLINASGMSARERNAYCNIGTVVALLNGNNSECLAGLSPKDPPAVPLTDDDPGYRDEGH